MLKNKRKLFRILTIVMISLSILAVFGNTAFAEINSGHDDSLNGLSNIIGQIAVFAISSALAGFATLITGLALFIYLFIYVAFSGAHQNFPAPDNIIFNRMGILDINIFNPNNYSIFKWNNNEDVAMMLQQMFNSFLAIAISVFVIAAVITGIKLAISTLASDKASCKKAMVNWVTGIIILFLIKFFIVVVLQINEVMTYKLGEMTNNIEFKQSVFQSIPGIGSSLGAVINAIAGAFDAENVGTIKQMGYGGFMTKYAWYAMGGDMGSAIIVFIILGQMFSLFVSYSKRLIYSTLLIIMAPITVAMDTLNKSIRGTSSLFSNWLKEFVLIVMMQSFHAIIMLIIMKILGSLQTSGALDAIVAIFLTTGLIKFEKFYKQMFGIGSSLMGDVKGQGGKILAGLHGAKKGLSSVMDNSKKFKESTKKRNELIKSRGEVSRNTAISNLELAAKCEKDPTRRQEYIKLATEAAAKAKQDGINIPERNFGRALQLLNNTAGGTINMAGGTFNNMAGDTSVSNSNVHSSYNGTSSSTMTSSNVNNTNSPSVSSSRNSNSYNTSSSSNDVNKEIKKELEMIRREISNEKNNNRVQDYDKQIKSATDDMRSAAVASVMSVPNLTAGIGFGLGIGDDINESLLSGGYVTAGLDAAAEKIGKEVSKRIPNKRSSSSSSNVSNSGNSTSNSRVRIELVDRSNSMKTNMKTLDKNSSIDVID